MIIEPQVVPLVPAYYQQRADYVMDIKIDDENPTPIRRRNRLPIPTIRPMRWRIYGYSSTRISVKKTLQSLLKNSQSLDQVSQLSTFANNHLGDPFDGGFNIEKVTDAQGKPLPYIINQTMMRIDLPTPLHSGGQVAFSIKWWYNINNHVVNRARSGYEYFPCR
jgi:hypothetical protein